MELGRSCYSKTGQEKVSYYTAKAARRAAKKSNKGVLFDPSRERGNVRSYKCPDCLLYHLGHTKKKYTHHAE